MFAAAEKCKVREVRYVCKDCGSQLPDRYKFCEVCGAETDSLISENGINNLYLSSVKRKKNQK